MYVGGEMGAESSVGGEMEEEGAHERKGHIFIGVAAGFPSCSTPSGGYPQASLSAALGVAALRAATDSKFTINSYF